MATLWTSAQLQAATGGEIVGGNWSVASLCIDTRQMYEGALFIPLKDRRDGHDFIADAYAGGARAVVTEHAELVANKPALLVRNSLAALQDMSVWTRKHAAARRIAVTGSVGKTSVKEALALMFAQFGATHKSWKSFNNHWGVPFSLASMPRTYEYGVFEMGMNHAGELTELSSLLKPHVAIITTMGCAHQAHFDSFQDIALAKAEIRHGLCEDGWLVLPADNVHTPLILELAKAEGRSCLTFGHMKNSDVHICDFSCSATQTDMRVSLEGRHYELSLNMSGQHWVENMAACLAVAHVCGVDMDQAAHVLQTMNTLEGRGAVWNIVVDGMDITLIDESYNANPQSMRAAIAALGLHIGRKVAVLGDMYELGRDELQFHAELVPALQLANVAQVISVGERMRTLKEALPQSMCGGWVTDWQAALALLRDSLKAGDVLLVKGSNGMGLKHLVTGLKQGVCNAL